MAHGRICWSELATDDVEAAMAHYKAIAGWTFTALAMGEDTYWVAEVDGEPVAGLMPRSVLGQNVMPHWLTYIVVPDVDAAVEAVIETGGTVIRQPFDVPNIGRIALVAEPGGAAYGIATPQPEEDADDAYDAVDDASSATTDASSVIDAAPDADAPEAAADRTDDEADDGNDAAPHPAPAAEADLDTAGA
ncbi:VOC family protein [Acuticoccus mangrovi]|uniref:VOC family protein n=1 Tax=Acuticoccus mangrovi TaxID=2796142 RepID=A0A934ITE0_9HYPH|nr:VOC family protein [Acuticoccus mangrovi]MBJ3777847.1 VOC family protein [Acuticoccus mangrovi]